MTLRMTATFVVDPGCRDAAVVTVRESSTPAGRLLRPAAVDHVHCHVLHAVWADCSTTLTGELLPASTNTLATIVRGAGRSVGARLGAQPLPRKEKIVSLFRV